MASKPYMPLMMGDWIRGTRGMRCEVKGVYIGLLIHQYDSGHLPANLEELALIEPEVGKVWVSLKDKFEEFEPGKLRNKKLEEVRDFWSKQSKNGKKGGRPKNEEPKPNPNSNPNDNPNPNLHNDLDLDSDITLKLNSALDEIYIEGIRSKWKQIDFKFQLESFKEKVRGSPEHYQNHETSGIRLALQHQLRNAKTNDWKSDKGKTGTNKPFSGDYSEPL
jgi:uncharacterized protein YdaU (DUF1376 family)